MDTLHKTVQNVQKMQERQGSMKMSCLRILTGLFCVSILSVIGCSSTNGNPKINESVKNIETATGSKAPTKLDEQTIDEVIAVIGESLKTTIGELSSPYSFPRSKKQGKSWINKEASDWTSGFFPGMLWYMYENDGDEYWRMEAEQWTGSLKDQQFDAGTHDIGFQIFCSFGNGYRLTSNEYYKDVILQTAATLSTRYNPVIGCMESWNDWFNKADYPVIIDNMMNLELMIWAGQKSDNSIFENMAISHAIATQINHIRPDGSTWHVVGYDEKNGSVVTKVTHQGFSDSSCWARGQAWGIYGFALMYRYTGNIRFLEAADTLAGYFIQNLPEGKIPYWDFNATGNPPYDSSAAAIAASGLLDLAKHHPDSSKALSYRDNAREILLVLSSPEFLNRDGSGVLLHGTGNYPGKSEIDVSLIYGDYYFLEALLRAKDL